MKFKLEIVRDSDGLTELVGFYKTIREANQAAERFADSEEVQPRIIKLS
jgi:hypothetical protein